MPNIYLCLITSIPEVMGSTFSKRKGFKCNIIESRLGNYFNGTAALKVTLLRKHIIIRMQRKATLFKSLLSLNTVNVLHLVSIFTRILVLFMFLQIMMLRL